MSSFIEIKSGLVRKKDISGLTRINEKIPLHGEYYGIEVHLPSTKVYLGFDSKSERDSEFNRIADELKREEGGL